MNRKQRRAENKHRGPVSQRASPRIQDVFADAVRHHQAGRLNEAERLYRQILQFDPGNAHAAHLLGLLAHQIGRNDIAVDLIVKAIALNSQVPAFHTNLGMVLQYQGKLDDAVASYREALALKGDDAKAHYNLGNALQHQGKLEDAVVSYQRAVTHSPDYVEAYFNLGNALQDQGKPEEAMVAYQRALTCKPDFAEAHNNLGNALMLQGKPDEALLSYERALTYKPKHAEAHCNLGNALHCLGKLDDAVISYERALEIKSDYIDALNGYALLLNAQGKPDRALRIVQQSLRIKETREAKNIFVSCIKHLRLVEHDSNTQIALVRALIEPWGRPIDLAPASSEFIKLNPDIGRSVARAAKAWPRRPSAQDLFGPNDLTTIAADPLLLALLNSTPVCDVEMERFLTMARSAMIEAASTKAFKDELGPGLDFYSALARQCFVNEYVFSLTDREIDKARNLRDSLTSVLESRAKVPILWPVAVGTYFPLGSLPLADRLFDTSWPEPVMAVLVQQIVEPREEQQLRGTIPRLTAIEDDVSVLVQKQYEENPYPRWVRAAPAVEAKDIVGYLSQRFPLSSFERQDKSGPIDVLVAGCGTGQHSIEVAQKFQEVKVLAVDLSMTSLAYAKRKTQELGFTTIDYAQADLLKLGSLDRRFHVIEAVGVLHHLAHPLSGWEILLSLLLPGGFMKLGFYSEVARRGIAKARAVIAEQGYTAITANDIRECRQHLMDADKQGDFATITNSFDFFSTSACRDLLFHAQEHCMTLSRIDKFCRGNNLTFLGFEIDNAVLRAYRNRFADDRAGTDLRQWQTFENENPATFFGMYEFWIQKGVDGPP